MTNTSQLLALPFERPYEKDTKLFKFANHHLYTDVPNELIMEAYSEILEKCDALPLDKAIQCAKGLVKEFNDSSIEEFRELSKKLGTTMKPFVRLNVYKSESSKKPILFQYYLNKKALMDFIEWFSSSDTVTLYEKYNYTQQTKFYGDKLSSATLFSFFPQNYVIPNSKMGIFRTSFSTSIANDKGYTLDVLDGLLSYINRQKTKIKKVYSTSATLRFIPEIISGIYTLKNLIENGYISACYREMRNLTERLSWFILDDYLSANSFGYWKMMSREIPSMLLNVNPQWRDKNTEQLRGLNDMFQDIKVYDDTKSKVKKELITRMSVEMYIVLFGESVNKVPENAKDRMYIPYIGKNYIEKGIKEVTTLLSEPEFMNSQYYMDIESFITKLNKKWMKAKYGIPKFPTSNFIFQFLKSAFSDKEWEKLQSVWHKYSLFIHPYLPTLQILPNFSMMEYKVLKHEIPTFESVVRLEMNSLSKYVQKLRKEYDN
jgi:hypothetical protein